MSNNKDNGNIYILYKYKEKLKGGNQMKKGICLLLVLMLLLSAFVFAEPVDRSDVKENTVYTLATRSAKKPVILVGGIGGTKLYKDVWWGSDELWFDEDEALFSLSDDFLNPLKFTSSGTKADSGTRTIRRSTGYKSEDIKGGLIDGIETYINIALQDIFSGLIDGLEDVGYVVGTNLFACPYDWRFDLNQSYTTLDEVIEIAKARSGWDKVDIIAHSMGGLFTKRYLYQSATNRSKVDKFITCGTPYIGAPSAAWAFYVGDNFSVLGGMLGINPAKVRELVTNFPSNHQLLPSRRYYDQVINASNGSLYTFDGIRYYSYIIENNYDANGNYSYYDQLPYNDIGTAINRWNGSTLYARNAQYHDVLDTVSLHNLGINHYVIAGKNKPTLYVMRINGGSSVTFNDLRLGDGDGTVPYASGIDTGILATAKYYVTDVSHGSLPSATPVVNTIKSLLATTTYSLAASSPSLTASNELTAVTDDTDFSSSMEGLVILCKADEMPVVYKKNNPKEKIGAGEEYAKYKQLLNKKDASENEKKTLKDAMPKIITNTIGKGSYIQQYGDMYVIYLPDKADYKVELKGSKNAALQIREYTNSQETIVDTLENITANDKTEAMTLEYTHAVKKMKKDK